MANKQKSFTWKGILIGLACLAVGVGGTVGVIKLVEHNKKPPENQEQVEQNPEDQTTIQTSIEEQIADVAVENIA